MTRASHSLLLGMLALGACAASAPVPTMRFDPFVFFDGAARSRGTITTALVFRQEFTAVFEGTRDGNGLVLDERFRFPEGGRLQRWRLRPVGDDRLAGTVETEGANGRLHAPVPVSGIAGPAGVELAYDGYAPGGDAILHFRHRMVPQADGSVENRVRVSRFGVPLARADVVFERVPRPAEMR